jgi:putative membrane protein
MFYQHHMGAGGWVFMALGNIVIWGLIVSFIIWLVHDLRTRSQRQHVTSGATASQILDRRLAGGEINADEYERLRTTLRQHTDQDAAHMPPRVPA